MHYILLASLKNVITYNVLISYYFSAFIKNAYYGITLLLLITNTLNAQTLSFKNYSTADGLITDEVYNLHQDKQGYIWVFSKYGTVKYNGTEFKPILKNLPLKESFIYCIYENKQGRKWVANSNAKIFEVRNDSAFLIKGIEVISTSLKNTVSEISKLYVDDSLNIFVITKGLCYKLRNKNQKYFPIKLNRITSSDSIIIRVLKINKETFPIADRFEYDDFLLTALKKQYFLRFEDKKTFTLPRFPITYPLRNFKKLKSGFYFNYSDFFLKIGADKELLYIKINSIVLHFVEDNNGHTWVACLNDGVYELNEQDSIIGHYIENTTVNDVLIDTDGGLWASTPSLGLFRCENVQNKYFTKEEALGIPISLIKKTEDKLFIANNKGDLFLKEDNEIKRIRKEDNNKVIDVLKEKDYYVILHSILIEKLNLVAKPQLKILNTTLGNHYNVLSKSTDTLIYVWRRGITFVVNNVQIKKLDFNRKILASELVNTMLWLGTENGVYCYKPTFDKKSVSVGGLLIPDKDSLMRPSYLLPTQNCGVVKVVKDIFDNLWFCGQGDGLFKLQNKTLTHYTTKQGLPSDIINNISFTNNNEALLSTNKGLFISKLSKEPNSTYKIWQKLYRVCSETSRINKLVL